MDIVYSSSDAYSECTGVSLFSLYLNNQDIDELNVNILSTDISDDNKRLLSDVAKQFNRTITIIDAKQDFIDEAERLHLKLLRGAYNTYSRVVLNRWFSHLDKIMVIDSDTMVCGSIKGAWELDMTNHLLAATPEVAIYNPYSHQEDMDLVDKKGLYYNMGICVVNLRKWREDRIDSIIEREIIKNDPEFKIADQSIINRYCGDMITRMPLKYNFYTPVHNVSLMTVEKVFSKRDVFTEDEFNDSKEHPSIIHYFGHSYERPWFKYSVAFHQKDYRNIRKKTPWGKLPLAKWRKENSIIIRIYDRICYVLLLLGLYSFNLKFRYIWGQIIKELLHIHR